MRVYLEGFEESVEELLAALDEETPGGVLAASVIVAEEAAAHHAYTNRTGTLQSRTVAGAVTGRFSEDTLRGEALGDTPYGQYVEEGTSRMAPRAFLAPAAERRETDTHMAIEAALARAASRAGW